MIEVKADTTGLEESLATHGYYASTTRGTSMEPLFRTRRDVVIVERPKAELKKYDVALYRVKDTYVMHRVIKVKEDEYLIRGDNTFVVEHVPKDRILGVLVEFNRKGKHHSVTERSFVAYSRFWNFIYPIRFLWHIFIVVLKKIYRATFKRKKKSQT